MNNAAPYSVSSTQNNSPKRRWFLWKMIVLVFVVSMGLLIGLVVALGIAWTIRENRGRAAMRVEFEKLQEEGIPTDNYGTSELYESRTSIEHSQEWEELFAELNSIEFTSSVSGVPILDPKFEMEDFADDYDVSAEWPSAETCIRFTKENSNLISKARTLANDSTPVCFPIVFQSLETLLPQVQDTRTLNRILSTDAQVAIHLRDGERAFDDIVAMLEISKHVDAVPCIVSRLVGIALREMAMKSLRHAIRLDLLDNEQLLRLDTMLVSHCDIGDRWRTMMADELSATLPVFVNPASSLQTSKIIPARGHDAVYFAGFMRRAIAIPSENWEQFYQETLKLESDAAEDAKSNFGAIDHILSHLLTPGILVASTALIRDAQLHRQARLAIAVRLFQHQHGKFPESLSHLPQQITLLPYGQKPFGYSVEGSRAVLWGTFITSSNMEPTSSNIPDTTTPNIESERNREVVWWLESSSAE